METKSAEVHTAPSAPLVADVATASEGQPLLATPPAEKGLPPWQPGQKSRLAVWTTVAALITVYGVSDPASKWPALVVGVLMLAAAISVVPARCFGGSALVIGFFTLIVLAVYAVFALTSSTSTNKAAEFLAWCPTACNESEPSNVTTQICNGVPGLTEYRHDRLAFYCMLRVMNACPDPASAQAVAMECHSKGTDAMDERHSNCQETVRAVLETVVWCMTTVACACACMWILDEGAGNWSKWARSLDERLGGRLSRWCRSCCRTEPPIASV